MQIDKKFGVAIGRFQLPELHDGHLHYLNTISDRHEGMIILVGYNTVRFNTNDPFPFPVRKQMLQSIYPDAIIKPLKDSPVSNAHWSEMVDAVIDKVAGSGGAVLYGGRDSFIPAYSGTYETVELDEIPEVSATAVREELGKEIVDSHDFRRGWLAAIHQQYPVTDPTADVAIVASDFEKVLMGKRGSQSADVRFFGGFVDPEDESIDEAALRERSEEVLGVQVSDLQYVASARIHDPRYGNGPYGVMTTLFALTYESGDAEAHDDMGDVEWCDLDESLYERIAPEHTVLLDKLLAYKAKKLAA